jgi:hypothetical protein
MKVLQIIILAALAFGYGSLWGYAQESSERGTESIQVQPALARGDDRVFIVTDEWRFIVAPYFWMVGTNINISKQGTRGATAAADIPWYNLVPDYFSKVFGAMTRIEAWKGRWGLFVDNVYLYVEDTVQGSASRKINLPNVPVPVNLIASGNMKLIVRQGFLDVGARYLLGTLPLGDGKSSPILTCELLGGARYNWYNQSGSLGVDATLTGPAGQQQITRGKNFNLPIRYMVVEPFLGVRTGFWFTEKLNLLLMADMGGFGIVAYEDFNSNMEALLGYKVHDHIRLYLGYRGRYYYFNKGNESVKSFGWYHGPVLGAVFSF